MNGSQSVAHGRVIVGPLFWPKFRQGGVLEDSTRDKLHQVEGSSNYAAETNARYFIISFLFIEANEFFFSSQ